MSMFKKLKGLFIEDTENSQKSSSNTQPKESADTDPVVYVKNEEYSAPPPTSTGQPDDKFVDILLKAIEKHNLEGFDYLEFKSSLQSLANMDMDESTKYKSALAMAKTMGATPDNLIKSADHYVSVLAKEKNKFGEVLKKQRAKQVTGREGQIDKTKKSIEAKRKQIADLQKQIEVDEKSLHSLKEGINKAAAKVQVTSDSFNYAYNVVKGQIDTDVSNMRKYLS